VQLLILVIQLPTLETHHAIYIFFAKYEQVWLLPNWLPEGCNGLHAVFDKLMQIFADCNQH